MKDSLCNKIREKHIIKKGIVLLAFLLVVITCTSNAANSLSAAFDIQQDNSLSVSFKAISTGAPTYWAWEFGDGQISSLSNPIHTYAKAGTYDVHLTVRDLLGQSAQFSEKITVNDIASAPDFPYIAAPIALIIGLIAIIKRKSNW